MDGSKALVLPYRTYVGFDNIPLASDITPGLDTIHLPAYQMGTLGVEALLDRIKKRFQASSSSTARTGTDRSRICAGTIPIEKRHVGMVFQNYALFPNMNVAENIAYGLKVRGDQPEKIQDRVDDMLAMMQIEKLRHRKIDQLSGGQKQRVALARAIAVRPRVLLLDEPLTALDAKLRDVLRVEIDMLLRSIGITAVYVTHDQAEAMALGDRIVVMSQGRIAQIGSPRQVYFKPANRFVADFIGTVNCITSSVENQCLNFPGGCIPIADIPGVDAAEREALNIFFRPEHAMVVGDGQGHFRAKVISSFFMGDRTRLIVNGEAPEPLKVEAAGRQSFQKGETVDIRIDLEALFTLSDG